MVIDTNVTISTCGCGAEERGIDPQFRLLAEAVPQLVWAARSDGSFAYVSRRFGEYTGLTAEQAGCRGLDHVLHPDDVTRCSDAWRAALEEGAAREVEVRLRRHDGVYRWFLGRVERFREASGRSVRWFGTATDIDGQRRVAAGSQRTEQTLRESEERLRLALAGGQLGSWELELASGRVFWPPETFALLGVDEAEFGGGIDDFRKFIHPEDRAAVAAKFESALRGETDYACEFRLVGADGQVRWLYNRALVLRDRDGSPLRMVGVVGDITPRKLAELTLRESEARFRNMADHASVMIWVTAPDASCTYLNRRWYEFTGQTEQTGLGFGWLAAVHPADRGASAEIFRRAHARREPFRLDYRLRRDDGVYRWCIDSASPRLGPDGEFLGYVGSVIDITERKEAELLLRESEERFRRAVMAIPYPVMIHAEDGQIVSINRAWTESSGYTRDEIPTIADWTEGAYGARRGAVRSVIDALYGMVGASREYEFTITTASGERRTWVFSAAPLGRDTSGRRLVISIAHDITERKRIDDALRESEARFRQLADAMPQIVWTARPDGSIDYYNRRWYELTGTTEVDPAGDGWSSFLHEQDHARTMDVWSRSVASGEPYEIETRLGFPAAPGHRWYLCRALPVRGPAGEIVRWYGTCTDIQDQKCAEATLKEADRRKDDFLAMLAHELRNPLGPIRNAVEILQRVSVQQPSLVRACGVIDRQVSHMARLVDDLFDVSRVARARIPLRKERCDLTLLVRQTAEDYRSTLEASGLRLDLELPSEPLWVSGDPTRLSQVISNVLHNAGKFTDPGGRVAVALSAPAGSAVVRIRDTGIGLEPGTLSRMFDPFSQAERSLDRSRGGLGLGLALVKGLVELHGGTAWAESAGVGHGTEVVLRLPLEHRVEPASARAAPSSRRSARSLRILIIEDNEDAAESLQALLTLNGHRVEVALSGPAGVEAASSFRPEVILCDLGLPGGMDGYGVARALRGSLDLAPSLMIALTGYGQEEDQRRVREAGFDMHVLKPIDPHSLQKLLASFTARA
ncbi:uncharacterized protein SOCE26_027320 [Sorangium cellulosum]|uniref:histidine kinase n=1 Tax=Sorangium cellulosum TaxID=56 RepID=A0A2L0EPY1_SORCE|nr:PAS domain S-box protein [Sorangium cellulosum]AUX41322.1 uncharacterized protein SOCE26_027320 [Sorangium cellulosum]